VIGTAQSIAEGKSLLESTEMDLLICDVQLSDGLSFELLKLSTFNCPTIFITAYDQYAIESFEHNCIDYILKPVNEDKLIRAIEKAKKTISLKADTKIPDELLQTLIELHDRRNYKKRFLCKIGDRVYFKSTHEIAFFYVEDKVTFLQDAITKKKYILNHSLDELEQHLLDSSKFYRINRSVIINLDYLVEMKRYNNGRLKLLTDHTSNPELIVARERVSDFKEWLNQ